MTYLGLCCHDQFQETVGIQAMSSAFTNEYTQLSVVVYCMGFQADVIDVNARSIMAQMRAVMSNVQLVHILNHVS